jgi:hypothetical protein
MKKILFILLTFYCSSLFSQTQHFTLGVNYPIPIGDNFITDNYNGIADAEIKYFPYKLKNLKLGVSSEIGLLTTKNDFLVRIGNSIDNSIGLTSVTLLLIKPGLAAEMEFGRFVPYAGFGYAFFNFTPNGMIENEYNEPNKDIFSDGINLNLGLKYNLFKCYFINVNFDYTRLRVEGELADISSNRDILLLKAGVGYRF